MVVLYVHSSMSSLRYLNAGRLTHFPTTDSDTTICQSQVIEADTLKASDTLMTITTVVGLCRYEVDIQSFNFFKPFVSY